MPTSFPAFDEIGLPEADRAGLAELLTINPQVRRVICGHVHRAFFEVLAGCGVAVCPSTWLQSPLEIGMTEIHLNPEPPAFMVHATTDGGVISHVQPIERRSRSSTLNRATAGEGSRRRRRPIA